MYIEREEPPAYHGKRIVETNHFHNELYDVYRKGIDFALELLEEGVHKPESREKVCVTKGTCDGRWELVYIEFENEVFLIHLKFRR